MFDVRRAPLLLLAGISFAVAVAASTSAPAQSSAGGEDAPPSLSDEVIRGLVSGGARTDSFSNTASTCSPETSGSPVVEIESESSKRGGGSGSGSEMTGRYRIESCDKFVDRLDAAGHRSTIGFEPWAISVGAGSIRYDGETVLTIGCADELDCARQYVERHYRLDSLVGPILSYREQGRSRVSTINAAGLNSRHALDLRTGEEAELTALIEPDSLLAAVKGDDWVQSQLSESTLSDVDSVDGLMSALKGRDKSEYYEPHGSYAFYAWDPDREKVAMRIWLERWVGNQPHFSDFKAIGVWVTPRSKFRDAAAAAAEGEGFYLSSDHRPTRWGLGDVTAMKQTSRQPPEDLDAIWFGDTTRLYRREQERHVFAGRLEGSPKFTAARATVLPVGDGPSRDLPIASVEADAFDVFQSWELTFEAEAASEYLDEFDDGEVPPFAVVYPPRSEVALVPADQIEDLPDKITRSTIVYGADINADGFADAFMVRFDCKDRSRAPHNYTCTEVWGRPGDEWQRRWRRTPR